MYIDLTLYILVHLFYNNLFFLLLIYVFIFSDDFFMISMNVFDDIFSNI